MPLLPPITKEQIAKGELKDLLEESDYHLSTMVTKNNLLHLPDQLGYTP